jgi:hypothetical protein
VIKYDRFQYVSSVTEWDSQSNYKDGALVRYDNRVWQAASQDSTAVTGPTFDLENWELVNPGTFNGGIGLSGADRTMGFYIAGVNSPGLELPLLIDGVDYPGVQVYGNYFLGDPGVIDATYQSEFTNTNLGTQFTDIVVDGGKFIGPYEGHAPEELINGSEFDTLDMRVFTRPGSDWNLNGHGFEVNSIRYEYQPDITTTYSWANVVEHPVQVLVSNITTGRDLYVGIDYVIDWDDQTVSFANLVSTGDILNISVYELGGGSQLYRANYQGTEVGDSVAIPVNAAEINDVAVFVNGTITAEVTWMPFAESLVWSILDQYNRLDVVINNETYYRALQDVIAGIAIDNASYWVEFVPTLQTLVSFGTTYGFDDGIALVAFGATQPIDYSWSTPQVTNTIADSAIVTSKTITLTTSVQGTNPANMIVVRNGRRLRPPEGIEWFGNNSTVEFGLPQRGGYQQSIIDPATDMQVWVDNVLQTQSLGAFIGDYSVTNWDGSNDPGRQVVFQTPPASAARILISVSTVASYSVVGNKIEIIGVINIGDKFTITTWNDTAQQNILTLVFQGPVTTGITIEEPYDSTDYDLAVITNTAGSYDYSVGVSIANNNFNLQRLGILASRLWVTLDGFRLFEGADYTVASQQLILASGPISPTQVLAVTEFTNNIVPEATGFRIFQDMRGVQATYRITAKTTTVLLQDLSTTDDTAHVMDASALSEPTLELGIFGVVTIDGERIMYRDRNVGLNTISGLRRGTAGTATGAHVAGADVYDLGRGNFLTEQYQDYLVKDITQAYDATNPLPARPISGETVFYAAGIAVAAAESIEVYVGGTRQYATGLTPHGDEYSSQYRYNVLDLNPVSIEFVVDSIEEPPLAAPLDSAAVTILVRRGVTWYQAGVVYNPDTQTVEQQPSNGVALQDTDTVAARFLRGI